MALFSFFIRCGDIASSVAQFKGTSPYDAVRAFLKSGVLRDMTAKAPDWPQDFSLRDVYIFIPLEGLPNAYYCGLGARGKYVEINLFQTSQRSSIPERYCGPRKKVVTLR
jgi:hypothetical protein